jgi:hypothetical protein
VGDADLRICSCLGTATGAQRDCGFTRTGSKRRVYWVSGCVSCRDRTFQIIPLRQQASRTRLSGCFGARASLPNVFSAVFGKMVRVESRHEKAEILGPHASGEILGPIRSGQHALICAVLLRLLRSGNQEPPEEVEFTLVIAGARMQGVVYRRNSPRRFVRRRQRAPSERQESI